jgi:hypothetical protein
MITIHIYGIDIENTEILPVDSGGSPDEVWEPRFWEKGHLGILDLGI